PNMAEWAPPASVVDTTRGTKARTENSNNSSSMASTTEASGVPKVAAMPPAAPQARRIFRSEGAAGHDDRPLGPEGPARPDGDGRRQRLGEGRPGRDLALLGEHRLHGLG